MAHLFTPYTLGDVTLRNRIAVSPMCQYMARDGVVNDWHHVHLGTLARGGAGLVVVEASAVSPEGRITPGDVGIWRDDQAEALAPIARAITAAGSVPGIQIAHAGRKAGANRPWEGDDHLSPGDPHAWQPIAPSAVAFGANLPRQPREMSIGDIEQVRQDFVSAAIRAREAGFKWLMLHFAHGYLAQSFFSPFANQRTDAYGGSAENRARFLVETLRAVRKVWPETLPLSVRLGVVEFAGDDAAMLAEALAMLRVMKEEGLGFVDVSIGFNTPTARIPWGPGFLGAIAGHVRRETGLPTATSWNAASAPQLADAMVRQDEVDLVMVGRPLLADPHWPYAAAKALGREDAASVLPPPYAHWLARYR